MSEAVNLRSRRDLIEDSSWIGRDGMASVVVGKEEENVRALFGMKRQKKAREKKESRDGFHGILIGKSERSVCAAGK